MTISPRDLRLLFQQSGNQCAFPDCTRTLTFSASDLDRAGALSEVAHIVSRSPDGPRGEYPLPMEERDRYENLILLCRPHHEQVDEQVATYPVERLRQMKYDHEALIADAMRRAVLTRAGEHRRAPLVTEPIYSSMLPVEKLPRHVFSIECEDDEKAVKSRLGHVRSREASAFVVRGNRLYCFHDLRHDPGPFAAMAAGQSIERDDVFEWWRDLDRRKWYVDLLNRTMNKIAGWRHLNLDKEHRRYYFDQIEPETDRHVKYRPMNSGASELAVVWRPITKKTGEPKRFWYHRAVAISFVQTGPRSWCLALRPEMRVTRDGRTPVIARKVGGKVTKKKSRMFNFDVLKELNFWRDYLCDGRARMFATFGRQGVLAVSANFLTEVIAWPGVPAERAQSFRNATVEGDLFDLADEVRLEAADEDLYEEVEYAESEE